MLYHQTVTLADGATLELRSMTEYDAPAALFVMKKILGETPYLIREADEWGLTTAQEAAYISGMNAHPREALIGAFIAGELVGMTNLSQVGGRRRVLHRASTGISLLKAHWGRGVGAAMLRACIAAARQADYEQLELEVVEKNERAVRLYEHLGFRASGRIPRAMKYADGSYADFLCMQLDLTARAAEPAGRGGRQ